MVGWLSTMSGAPEDLLARDAKTRGTATTFKAWLGPEDNGDFYENASCISGPAIRFTIWPSDNIKARWARRATLWS